jgi:phage portal protein BeeE
VVECDRANRRLLFTRLGCGRVLILPLAGKILDAIAEGLRPWFAGLELAVDPEQVSALSEDRERLWAQVSGVDFLTLDEKRALVGYGAVQHGTNFSFDLNLSGC